MKLLTKIVLFFLFTHITTNKDIKVFLQKSIGTCNKKYCNISISCRPINRTSKLSSMDVYIRPGIILKAPIYVEITAYKKFATIYRSFMFHTKVEICGQLELRTHPLYQIHRSDLTGNFWDPCPFSGHRYMQPRISNVQDYDALPLIPAGEWMLEYKISKKFNESLEPILSWSDFYEVKPTSATEF